MHIFAILYINIISRRHLHFLTMNNGNDDLNESFLTHQKRVQSKSLEIFGTDEENDVSKDNNKTVSKIPYHFAISLALILIFC